MGREILPVASRSGLPAGCELLAGCEGKLPAGWEGKLSASAALADGDEQENQCTFIEDPVIKAKCEALHDEDSTSGDGQENQCTYIEDPIVKAKCEASLDEDSTSGDGQENQCTYIGDPIIK